MDFFCSFYRSILYDDDHLHKAEIWVLYSTLSTLRFFLLFVSGVRADAEPGQPTGLQMFCMYV